MGKIKEWYKGLTRQAKIMLLFVILLVIAIITRWEFVSLEISSAFRDRFNHDVEQVDTVNRK